MSKLSIIALRISIVVLLSSNTLWAKCKQQRVAIIDTGLDPLDSRFTSLLCRNGHHWDFVENTPLTHDCHNHGTHVAGLIKENAKNANYCLLVYRYYDSGTWLNSNLTNEVRAIEQAAKDGATIVNFSSGGTNYSARECEAIRNNPNITFVFAAGNDNSSIDPPNGYYPACCGSSNIIVVGALDDQGQKLPSSNYGSIVKAWEIGLRVLSTLPNGRMGTMSGTSMSTAIHTGKVVFKNDQNCDIGE